MCVMLNDNPFERGWQMFVDFKTGLKQVEDDLKAKERMAKRQKQIEERKALALTLHKEYLQLLAKAKVKGIDVTGKKLDQLRQAVS